MPSEKFLFEVYLEFHVHNLPNKCELKHELDHLCDSSSSSSIEKEGNKEKGVDWDERLFPTNARRGRSLVL